MAIPIGRLRQMLSVDEPNYAALARFGPSILPLLDQVLADPSEYVAANAASLAGMIDDRRSVDVLQRAARHASAHVRLAAAGGLRRVPRPEAAATIASLLNDRDKGVRKFAIKAAVASRNPSLIAKVATLGRGDPVPALRTLAARVVLPESTQEVGEARGSRLLLRPRGRRPPRPGYSPPPAPSYGPRPPGYTGTGYTQCDFIDQRIDVYAQRALYQMVKSNGPSRQAAIEMLSAVRAGQLAGIYQEDQRVPALRARALGKGWWQVIPQGQGAVCIPSSGYDLPIIAFKKTLSSDRASLSRTLLTVWTTGNCRPRKISIVPPSGKPCPARPTGSAQAPTPAGCTPDEFRRLMELCDGNFAKCREVFEGFMNLDLARCQGNEACRREVLKQWLPQLEACDNQYRACRQRCDATASQ